MNTVTLIGNLTRDPETRTTDNGTSVTSFTIAVNTGWGDNKKTAFIPIKAWSKTAESCSKYLTKGAKVAITGRIDTGSYERDGKKIFTWEVTANNVEFLDTKKSDSTYDSSSSYNQGGGDDFDRMPSTDDDMPFDEDIPF
ncbi:MAG: single-stranded DNA-binding protein [Candidatus Muiribacteriota bacterium]|jgi:single-strand DNA-binding protein